MKARLSIDVKGAVQGVGFRPFIHRIANELGLAGYVLNSPGGVNIEVEGELSSLEKFKLQLQSQKPRLAVITSCEFSYRDPAGYNEFEIRESLHTGETQTLIMPDISICNDCLAELFDPSNRRYLYPFINCTNCGPRFSIIEKLPYDRPNTSMKIFEMCDDCRAEYENIVDRRYHAQPVACEKCGPHVELWDNLGNKIVSNHQAVFFACDKIRKGKIVAVKGLGGFQLFADALNNKAIKILRERKHRDEKPFAVMFPDINWAKNYCNISPHEEGILLSPESPIVLVNKKAASFDAKSFETCAPANPYLGIMLPYTPLHHILMRELQIPVIATSGNISEEPMCIDEYEALRKLNGIADYFLVHNRPVLRYVDDSIVRIVKDRPMMIRRARGYVPLPVQIKNLDRDCENKTILALGGHLKNTVALKHGENVFLSQHIGDLSNSESFTAFKNIIADFQNFYKNEPDIILGDQHPDYLSTKYGKSLSSNFEQIQHHYAHVASCRIENEVSGDALGVSWDGTGFGSDSTIWGGEFFVSGENSYSHIGQFKQFMLPGGEAAVKESKRSAVGVLYSLYGNEISNHLPPALKKSFSAHDLKLLIDMMERKINSQLTSSVGRLFDAVSSLLGICHLSNYEGHAAMMLEFAAAKNVEEFYPFEIEDEKILIINWHPAIRALLTDIESGLNPSVISAKFHNTLTEIILAVAIKVGLEKIILSGGCFQNLYLLERTIDMLQKNKVLSLGEDFPALSPFGKGMPSQGGAKVYWHQRIPTNDGGISLGQIAAYLSKIKNRDNDIYNEVVKEKI